MKLEIAACLWRESAKAREEQAKALQEEDEKAAEMHAQIAEALGGYRGADELYEKAAEALGGYQGAAELYEKGNSEGAQKRMNEVEVLRAELEKLPKIAKTPNITLDHFRAALEAHPEAERFIVFTHQDESCSIEPQVADPNASGDNRAKNREVIDTLRTMIASGVTDDLLRCNNSASVSVAIDPLSAARLRAILERAPAKNPKQEDVSVGVSDFPKIDSAPLPFKEEVKKLEEALNSDYTKNSYQLLSGSPAEWNEIINKVSQIQEKYALFLKELEEGEIGIHEKSHEKSNVLVDTPEVDEGQKIDFGLNLEKIKNQHALWQVNISWYKAKQAECVAFDAGVKARAKAHKIAALIPWTEAWTLQQEARQAESDAKCNFEQTIAWFQQGLKSAASTDLPALQFPWIEKLQNLTNWNSPNDADKPFYKEQKERIMESLGKVRESIPLFPHEEQSGILDLKNATFRAANMASEEYVKALGYDETLESSSTKKTGDSTPTSWEEVYESAKGIRDNWRRVQGALGETSPEIRGYLKEWIQKEESIAQRYTTDWTEVLDQFNPLVPSNPPSTLKELSKEDLREFPYASLKEANQDTTLSSNLKQRRRILKTISDNPYILIEELIDLKDTKNKKETILHREKMVADHLLLSLKEEEDPASLLDLLKKNCPDPI